jgi:hypothetical protein
VTQIVALDHKGNISDAVDAELAEHANEIRKLGKRAIGDVIEVGIQDGGRRIFADDH